MKPSNLFRTVSHSPSAASTLACDLLPTDVSGVSFENRVKRLNLTVGLERKILGASNSNALCATSAKRLTHYLTADNEKELGSEALLLRHKFSTTLLEHPFFRQAALTVIQNIYLFKHRRIFFSHQHPATDYERQDALFLFSSPSSKNRLSLPHTLQHPIIAKIWQRILAKAPQSILKTDIFHDLLQIVEDLNTIRNCYVLLTRGLVYRLVRNINKIYKSSITFEDAVQIGSLGIARASYRYHQSCGVRFSTFSSRWVMKEIQRQALKGRLIKISAPAVERYSKKTSLQSENQLQTFDEISRKTTVFLDDENQSARCSAMENLAYDPLSTIENSEQREMIREAVDCALTPMDKDIIKRRFGLPPYAEGDQSVISIAKTYRVTRSSIYQREQKALAILRKHLKAKSLCPAPC